MIDKIFLSNCSHNWQDCHVKNNKLVPNYVYGETLKRALVFLSLEWSH